MAVCEERILAKHIARCIHEIFWAWVVFLGSATVFLWPNPDLPEQLVYHPRRSFEVATAAESVPEVVGCNEFAQFVVEGGLLYFQFVEA